MIDKLLYLPLMNSEAFNMTFSKSLFMFNRTWRLRFVGGLKNTLNYNTITIPIKMLADYPPNLIPLILVGR